MQVGESIQKEINDNESHTVLKLDTWDHVHNG